MSEYTKGSRLTDIKNKLVVTGRERRREGADRGRGVIGNKPLGIKTSLKIYGTT